MIEIIIKKTNKEETNGPRFCAMWLKRWPRSLLLKMNETNLCPQILCSFDIHKYSHAVEKKKKKLTKIEMNFIWFFFCFRQNVKWRLWILPRCGSCFTLSRDWFSLFGWDLFFTRWYANGAISSFYYENYQKQKTKCLNIKSKL